MPLCRQWQLQELSKFPGRLHQPQLKQPLWGPPTRVPLHITQLRSPAAGLAARHYPEPPHLGGGAQQGGLGDTGRQLPVTLVRSGPLPSQSPCLASFAPSVQQLWEHPVLPAHLEVPLCWEWGKQTGLGGFNKAHRWPLSELSPALALSCCSSGPAHPGLGAAQPSPNKALLPSQSTADPQAQGSLNTPGNGGAFSNRQLSLQDRTCDSSPCMPILRALGQ